MDITGRTNGKNSSEYGVVRESRVWAGVGYVLSAILMFGPPAMDLARDHEALYIVMGAVLAGATSAYKGFVALGYIRARTDLKRAMIAGEKCLIGLCLAGMGLMGLSGCSLQMSRLEDADGTTWKSISLAPPFSKADEMASKMRYEWDGAGAGAVVTGQDATGLDLTGPVEALTTLGRVMELWGAPARHPRPNPPDQPGS